MSNIKQTIGVWMSDKKSQKLNWKELMRASSAHGYKLLKVDLEKPLEEQGEIDVFLHKVVDIIAVADQGDSRAKVVVSRLEQYLSNHPQITVIDPLENVRILLNRYRYYSILENEPSFKKHGIFTPAFAELTTTNHLKNVDTLRRKGVTFPVICKPSVAHGSKSAHDMIVIFNERGLRVCKPPCVVQSFVNHNAVLHKVFLVGKRYHICERPSLKNFYPSEECDPIFYSTGEVCKADSQSTLSILDPHDQPHMDVKMTLDESKIKNIIRVIEKEIGLILAGVDVVIDNVTGNHAVIDINVFPSYDNFPNFFDHLLDCIDETVDSRRQYIAGHNDMECLGYYGDELHTVCNNRINSLVNVGASSVKISVMGMNVN